jgi:cyclopropane fatty-acyl-phospholipid synthase-like methyltransferase
MKSIEECVVRAMDGEDKELFPYLPYILKDLWEIGADPEIIISLIDRHFVNPARLSILDLGCGKGAVSVKIANKFGCSCHGIDAIHEFISDARKKALEYNVEHLCRFEVGDIRLRVNFLSSFDIIILGAIGPVFGDYFTTLTTLSGCLNDTGVIIIDDSYIENNSDYSHPLIQKQSKTIQEIHSAGMQIIEEVIIGKDHIKESDNSIFDNLKKRCLELMALYPHRKDIFMNYIKKQEEENFVLENKVICSTMLIKRIDSTSEII